MQKNTSLVDAEENDRDNESIRDASAGQPPSSAGSAGHAAVASAALAVLTPAARLLLVVGLFLVGINLRPAISSLAPVLASVRDGTGMSSAAAGVLTTLPVLCFGLFAPLAPRLARRFAPEMVVLTGILVMAAGIGMRSLAGIPGLFLGTLIIGASISVVMVLLPGIIKRDFPEQAGPMTGLYTMALCLGAAVAAGTTVPIQELAGGDWRPALAFWLLPALLAAIAWWPQLVHHSQKAGRAHYAVRGLLSDPLAWQVTLYSGMQSALAYIIFGWLPTILIERGMRPLDAGFVLSVSIAMQLVTALAGPWLATRGRDQRAVIAVMMLMSTVGFLGSIYAPLDTIWPWAIILGLGQGGAFSVAMTLLVLRSPNPHVAASLSGMSQGFGYVIAAAGPFLVGVLHDISHGWDSTAILFSVVVIAAFSAGMGAGRSLHVSATTEKLD